MAISEYQLLVSDFENETTAIFEECLQDSGFQKIVDNFKDKEVNQDSFNTLSLLVDYTNEYLI